MSTVEGKKQEKRRALLDAAYELFLERGTAKTSVEDITSRAKVANPEGKAVTIGQMMVDDFFQSKQYSGPAGAGELPAAEQCVRGCGAADRP